jgi:hypothetical protein
MATVKPHFLTTFFNPSVRIDLFKTGKALMNFVGFLHGKKYQKNGN